MTQGATEAFTDFYTTFAAPFGEYLPLKGPFDTLVYAEAEGSTLFLEQRTPVSRKLPDIELRTKDGAPCLYTQVNGAGVYAHDWLHLADQLEALDSADFPDNVQVLIRQVGGDADAEGVYKLAI